MRALLDEKTQRVAIAVPERAPYGAAALQALRRYAIYDQVRAKLVFGDSLGQAAQFAESGAAQVGLIGLSLALAPSMSRQGRYWLIPEDAHQPIRQALVILKRPGRDRALAERFTAFFFTPAGQKALVEQGYGLPGHPMESRP
jgi:molybdate transport system substrate-binding protein